MKETLKMPPELLTEPGSAEPELLSKCQLVASATSAEEEEEEADVATEIAEDGVTKAEQEGVAAEGAVVITGAAERAAEAAAAAETTAAMTEDAVDAAVTTENVAARAAVTAGVMVAAGALALAAVAGGVPLPPPLAQTHERGPTPGRGWTKPYT